MCIIAVSRKGAKQPTLQQLAIMFAHNPHGAGYMTARDGKVIIHKGFLVWEDFQKAIEQEHFTKADPVVYHFRISTQAGVNPAMTHPFPLTSNPEMTEKLDVSCPVGLAHNGIIRLTSDSTEKRYSDTSIFITRYMSKLIRNKADVRNQAIHQMIDTLTESKWAIMDGTGLIVTIGRYIPDDGILFSNSSYQYYYYQDLGGKSYEGNYCR